MLKVVGASWSRIRLSTWIIGVVIALGIVAIVITEVGRLDEDGNFSATAYYSDEAGWTAEFWGQGKPIDEIPKGVARAHFDPHNTETGWAIFQAESQSSYGDEIQAYAAGYLEGALTWQFIYWQWSNNIEAYCADKRVLCADIRHFLLINQQWVYSEAMKNKKDDVFWRQVFLFYQQLEGIQQGYRLGLERSRQDEILPEIPKADFLWMNMLSDQSDLEQTFSISELSKLRNEKNATHHSNHRFNEVEEAELLKINNAQLFDCGYEGLPLSSSFVKIVPEKGSLFFAHNSGGAYSQMLKMFKKYDFGYHFSDAEDSKVVPGTSLSFSSYPGAVHSMDDYYVLSNPDGHSMAVSATPIPIFNTRLWHYINAKNAILAGPRAMSANRLANNPEEWTDIYSRFTSSSIGNKQWIIVDMKTFDQSVAGKLRTGQKDLSNLRNLMWVLEQVPGENGIVAADQTQTLLNNNYWAGYGIPFYDTISEMSGFKKMEEEHGSTFSYDKTALANIFRRDQANATTFVGVQKLMRSNLYKVDPYSEGNPRCAIGSRGDVRGVSTEPEPVGVTDIKVLKNRPVHLEVLPVRNSTVRVMASRTPRLIISAGPAYSNNSTPVDLDDVEPFSWSNSTFTDVPHMGQPDVWDFDPLPIEFI